MVKHVVLPPAAAQPPLAGHAQHALYPRTTAGARAGGGGSHPDAWHQFEGLIAVLIVIHVAAFAFWCYLLVKSRSLRDGGAKGGGARPSSQAPPGAAAAAAAAASEWKSPKDVLKAYRKAQLGKA